MESFEEIQKKLEEYKSNFEKVQKALKNNSEKVQDEIVKNQREKDLTSLLQDIEKGITYYQDLLKLTKTTVENYFSSIRLKSSDIGRKCNLYYENDQNWYPGEINSVNVHSQTAEVTFFGFSQKFSLPASYIQILIPPKITDLREGLEIEALLQDGKWHNANIENIKESEIIIRIAKWGHIHSVTLDSIRLISEEKQNITTKAALIIPEKFKILPNDPENVRLKKKKKIKALKKAWRMSQNEKETKEYVSSWKNFQQKNVGKKESIFKSPETFTGKIGVTKSGLGMTPTIAKAEISDLINDNFL